MRFPLISIVIPLYRKTYLRDQLQYIINMRGFDSTIEVIVVENPQKTDEAAQIIQSFGQSNIRHLESPAGANRARNVGVNAAKSDKIALLDDDCFPEQGWLQALLGLYALYPRCNVFGGAVMHRYEGGRPRWFCGYLRDLVGFLFWGEHTVDVSWRNSPVDSGLLSANLSFRKSNWNTVDGFDEHLGQQNGHQPKESCADEISFINRLGILPNNHYITRMYSGKMLAWHNIPIERMTIGYLQKKAYGHGKGTVDTAFSMLRHKDDFIEDVIHELLIPQFLSIFNEHDMYQTRLEIGHEESTRIFVKNAILCRTAFYQGFMDQILQSGNKSYEDLCNNNPLFFVGERFDF